MNNKSRMYEVDGIRVKTWNPFVGCKFNCKYCYAPEIYKRFSKCEDCKAFTPHFHPERLKQKFKLNETVFVCSMGDISFTSFEQFNQILEVTNHYIDTNFYIQSKNPAYFNEYIKCYSSDIRSNIFLGTTIETNWDTWIHYHMSDAPPTEHRYSAMVRIPHKKYMTEPHKYVTIEPIIEFDMNIMIEWLKEIAPEFVYVGYLNPEWKAKKLQIQEPPLQKTLALIEELEKFTEVRLKTIRKRWSEK